MGPEAPEVNTLGEALHPSQQTHILMTNGMAS